jgi:hypothetical protein
LLPLTSVAVEPEPAPQSAIETARAFAAVESFPIFIVRLLDVRVKWGETPPLAGSHHRTLFYLLCNI